VHSATVAAHRLKRGDRWQGGEGVEERECRRRSGRGGVDGGLEGGLEKGTGRRALE